MEQNGYVFSHWAHLNVAGTLTIKFLHNQFCKLLSLLLQFRELICGCAQHDHLAMKILTQTNVSDENKFDSLAWD